jgi:putative IMPACT (imprinted ancient) family translation regulator
VPASPQRRIHVSATWSDLQTIEHRLEKNWDVNTLPFSLHAGLCTR